MFLKSEVLYLSILDESKCSLKLITALILIAEMQ